MSQPQLQGEGGTYQITGELNFATVTSVLEEGRQRLFQSSGQRIDLDLAGVTRADSAGLALLIEWMRLAQQHQVEICFHHLPEQLLAIARAGELDSLLPVSR